uniref:Mob1/phocein family protein n=1 Tax=Rhabditophanes sp. KR3021 TaxID=114890 RepID=A0AC35TKV1_9BILA
MKPTSITPSTSRSTKFDTKQTKLLRHSTNTLGSGSIKDAVKLPESEDLHEWIAVNIVDLFNQINMLYGTISEKCTSDSCPKMSAGCKYEYYWSDGDQSINFPAPQYIDYLLTWVQDQLDDENIFPSLIGKQFPVNFLHISATIMKRLFRIYAHIYYEHLDYIKQLNAVEHLNTSFKHFILFVQEFSLINEKQLAPLADLIHIITSSNNASFESVSSAL